MGAGGWNIFCVLKFERNFEEATKDLNKVIKQRFFKIFLLFTCTHIPLSIYLTIHLSGYLSLRRVV